MFNLQQSWRQTPSQKKCPVFQVTSVYFQCLGELKHVFGLNRRRNNMHNTLHRNRKLKQVSSPCFCQQRRLSNDMETSQKRMINQRNRFSSFNYLVLSDFSEILIHQPQTPSWQTVNKNISKLEIQYTPASAPSTTIPLLTKLIFFTDVFDIRASASAWLKQHKDRDSRLTLRKNKCCKWADSTLHIPLHRLHATQRNNYCILKIEMYVYFMLVSSDNLRALFQSGSALLSTSMCCILELSH